MAGFDRECPAFRRDDGGAVQQPGDRRAVQGGGHDQQAQVVAQDRLGLEAQRQAQIGVQAAFMELVEQDGADPFQGGIALELPDQDALGHDFDPGLRPDLAVHPDAVADGFADGFPQHVRHPAGCRAGGQSARLQHHDLRAGQPRLVQQRQRDAGGLAGAGRRLEDGVGSRGQGPADVGKDRIDRQG